MNKVHSSQKYISSKERIRNIQENMRNQLDYFTAKRKGNDNFRVFVYANLQIMSITEKALKNFDKRIITILPDQPSLIYGYDNGLSEDMMQILSAIDSINAYPFKKPIQISNGKTVPFDRKIRKLMMRLVVLRIIKERPDLKSQIEDFLLWITHKYQRTHIGYNEIITVLI